MAQILEHHFSRHAQRRLAQRGIQRDVVSAIIEHADHRKHCGGGCLELGLTRKRLRAMPKDFLPPELQERLSGMRLVMAADGTVVTVYPKRGKRMTPGARRGR